MNAPSLLVPLLLITSLLSGCASEGGSSTVEVSLVPQNHSGKPYTFHVEILDAQNQEKFDQNYTLSENDHSGPMTKLSLATGTYKAELQADRADEASPKSTSTTVNFSITKSSKQVAVMIETDETLKVRVS